MLDPDRGGCFAAIAAVPGRATELRKAPLFGLDEVCGLLASG